MCSLFTSESTTRKLHFTFCKFPWKLGFRWTPCFPKERKLHFWGFGREFWQHFRISCFSFPWGLRKDIGNTGTGLLLFLHSPPLSCFSFPEGSAVFSLPHSSIYSFSLFISKSRGEYRAAGPGQHPPVRDPSLNPVLTPEWQWGGGKHHRLSLSPDWAQIMNRKGIILLLLQWYQCSILVPTAGFQ